MGELVQDLPGGKGGGGDEALPVPPIDHVPTQLDLDTDTLPLRVIFDGSDPLTRTDSFREPKGHSRHSLIRFLTFKRIIQNDPLLLFPARFQTRRKAQASKICFLFLNLIILL